MHYVYIIYSSNTDVYYRGYSADPHKRLGEHNAGLSHYTSTKGPWRLVHIEVLDSKEKALKRERSLKKYSHKQIIELAASPKNILIQKADASPQIVGD